MENEPSERVKTDIWFPFYIGDYLRDTMHLRAEEHGVYLLLLLAAWGREGKLPNDEEFLFSVARCSRKKWKMVFPKVSQFFVLRDGNYEHKRVIYELEKARKSKENKRKAGKVGADKRWNSNSTPIVLPLANDSPSPSPSPSPSKKEQRSKISCPIGFEKFWDIYPKKEGKGAAKKAYEKAIFAGASPETLLAAVALAKDKSDKWRDGFIPMPTTWLNQERWEDEFNPSVIEGRIKRSPGGEAAQRVLESIRASNGGGNNGQNRGADV